MSLPTRPLVRALTALCLVPALVAGSLAMASGAQAQRIRSDFWGMHDNDWTTPPSVGIGAANLTTSGTYWKSLEKPDGTYDWDRLAAQVDAAEQVGAKPMIVVGRPPRIHSSAPDSPDYDDYMPIGAAWQDYVTHLVDQFGDSLDYQIWPEPNIIENWKGTPGEMAWLTATAADIIHARAPGARVVSPAMTLRLRSQRTWMTRYFRQKVGGKRVHAYVDAIALDPFPHKKGAPEDAYRLMRTARQQLAKIGVRKPLWNNEINYGVEGGGETIGIRYSVAKQQSSVIRTYALSAAAGMQRTYWLGWFTTNTMAVKMATIDGAALAPARSYGAVHRWINGTAFKGCRAQRNGVWVCTARKNRREVHRIYWKPRGRAAIRTPRGTRRVENQAGRLVTRRSHKRLRVTFRPIMVSSRR